MLRETLTSPGCTPVKQEFGDPVNTDLLNSPDFNDVVATVAETAIRTTEWQNPGHRATTENVIRSLGCASCNLTPNCSVKENLHTIIIQESQAERREMIASSPRWLAVARLSQARIQPHEFKEILNSSSPLNSLNERGVGMDQLLGGVMNSFSGVYTSEDLPELQNTFGFNGRRFEAHDITTASGHKFTVIDATRNPEKQNAYKEYAILCSKLLAKMKELDASGRPQIMNEDQKIQKAIQRNGDRGTIYEIRMSGKNRLYFSLITYPEDTEGSTARIIILGHHGGDAKTQREFIDNMLVGR